ncbi:FkbM family methyltransferase [uncultured Croceitalea sp.]|uniref:FkbM family methyltransferase n=1 Tax=uncultured Croceitalea sp. TaxID=1798908 RepID=UPI003305920D
MKVTQKAHTIGKKILWKSVRHLKKSTTIKTDQGIFTIPLRANDPISKSLFVHNNYELDFFNAVIDLLEKLGKFTKGTGTIVDIGANNGVISIGALTTGAASKAIAIEPDATNFSWLTHNVVQNKLENSVETLNYAVSDCESVLKLEKCRTNLGDHRIRKRTDVEELYYESKREVVSVKSNTLDNLLVNENDDLKLIWVDVQGHEGYVFKGAKNTLSKRMSVVSEVWPYGIRRSGISKKCFFEIVRSQWSSYWVMKEKGFVNYPIENFYQFMEELGDEGNHDNVVFTN